MDRKSSKLQDGFCLGLNIGTASMGLLLFTKSVADYYAQANALIERIYSMADQITPEVVEQANKMWNQFAEKPNFLSAGLVGLGSILGAYYANKLGNPRNYEA